MIAVGAPFAPDFIINSSELDFYVVNNISKRKEDANSSYCEHCDELSKDVYGYCRTCDDETDRGIERLIRFIKSLCPSGISNPHKQKNLKTMEGIILYKRNMGFRSLIEIFYQFSDKDGFSVCNADGSLIDGFDVCHDDGVLIKDISSMIGIEPITNFKKAVKLILQ